MWHSLLSDASFFEVLRGIDEDTVREVQQGGCQHCRGPLDHADYWRQPRGMPAALEEEGYVRRPSLCCRREGCRRRETPRLLTFLGRCVYVSVAVVVAAAMTQGATPDRVRAVCEATAASPRTVRRWLAWWRASFPLSRPWLRLRPSLMGIDESSLPGAVLERFKAAGSSVQEAGVLLLRAVSVDEVPRMA